MKNYQIIFLWLGLLLPLLTMAQGDISLTSYDILSVSENMPTSPEASELGQYGKFEATPYNGSANIAIPIHVINFEGKQIPIQLTYDSGGVRVAQEASSVGLSWNLSTNYGISRRVYGTTDLNEYNSPFNGYIYNDVELDLPAGATNPSRMNYDDILNVHYQFFQATNTTEGSPSDNLDTQPDIFTANVLGKSYKFVLNKRVGSSNTVTGYVFDSQNIEVTLDLNNLDFTLKDEDGFLYEFQTKEISTTFSTIQNDASSPASSYNSAFAQIFADQNKADASQITNWSLDKVTSPNGRELNFVYEDGLHFTFPQYSFSNDGRDGSTAIPIWPEAVRTESLVKIGHNVSTTVVENHYLKEINGDFGKVVFNHGNRDDLSTGNTIDRASGNNLFGNGVLITGNSQIRSCHGTINGCSAPATNLLPLKIDNIQVYDFNQNNIVDAQLGHSYFNSNQQSNSVSERYLRLKLDNITINDQSYAFEYIDPNGLPAKDSDGIDFWGFANGMEIENDGIVPRFGRFLTKTFNFGGGARANAQQFVKFEGADRRSRFNHAKSGLLKGIIYPTGGATELVYEPHDIVMPSPRAWEEDGMFSNYPQRFRWTNLRDEAKFNNTYHFLKNAYDPFYNYYYVENPTVQGDPITLDYRLNQIFNVEFPSVIRVESYLRTETGASGISYWGSTILLAVEDVNDGTVYPMLYYSDAPSTNGGNAVFVDATVAIPVGSYRLIRRSIYVPDGNYAQYPPTPAISTNSTRLYLDTFENDSSVSTYLERFEIGGARVKQIINKDAQGNFVSGKTYQYHYPDGFDGLSSSGKLMDDLVFYSKTKGFYSYSPRGTGDLVLNGQNMVGGQPSAQGSHIGYSFVREKSINASGDDLGWVDRYFENQPNKYHTSSFTLPFQFDRTVGGVAESSTGDVTTSNTIVLGLPLLASNAHANGNVIEERVFDSMGYLKQRTQNEYVNLSGNTLDKNLANFKTYTLNYAPVNGSSANLNHMTSTYNTTYGPWGSQDETYYTYQFPQHYGQKSKLYETKTISYDNGPELVRESITGYDNDTHHPRFSKVMGSDGSQECTNFYYPYDPEVSSQSGIATLLSENQLTAQVRTEAFKDDELLTSQRTNYANNNDTGNNTLPINVQALKGIPGSSNNHYEERIRYEVFGPHGTVRQYRATDGSPTTLIWGYKYQYVVAEIKNATYSQIASQANSIAGISDNDTDRTKGYAGQEGALRQALNSIRQSLGSDAQMVSYTYDPMIGMTSMTDAKGLVTYYEYDDDNRLLNVKDYNEDMLQEYAYNYSGTTYSGPFSDSPYVDPNPDGSSGGTGYPPVTATIAYTDSSSTHQTFMAQVSGGNGTYTYEWFDGIGNSSGNFETTVSGSGSSYLMVVSCNDTQYVKLVVTSNGESVVSIRKNGNSPCDPGDPPIFEE